MGMQDVSHCKMSWAAKGRDVAHGTITLLESLVDDDALIYTNAEVHQHPWLATCISIIFLIVIIAVIIWQSG